MTPPDVGEIARWMRDNCAHGRRYLSHELCPKCIGRYVHAKVEAALRDAPETKFNNICEAVNTCDRCEKDDPDVAQFCEGCLDKAVESARCGCPANGRQFCMNCMPEILHKVIEDKVKAARVEASLFAIAPPDKFIIGKTFKAGRLAECRERGHDMICRSEQIEGLTECTCGHDKRVKELEAE